MPVKTPTVQELSKMSILNPAQREMLSRETSTLDRAINGRASMDGQSPDGMSLFEAGSREGQSFRGLEIHAPHLPDANILQEQLVRNRKTLKDNSAPVDKDGSSYSPQQKNQLWRMAKALRDKIKENRGLLSYDQLERPTIENTDAFRLGEERTINDQLALRNIHRILDPHDETVILETLRPTTAVHVDWESYWGNYEKIFFSEASELDRQIATLDDDTYLGFLKLKAMGVTSPKLIMRELNLTQAAYEACMVRLKEELGARQLLDVGNEADEDHEAPVAALESDDGEQEVLSKAERAARRLHGKAESMSKFEAK